MRRKPAKKKWKRTKVRVLTSAGPIQFRVSGAFADSVGSVTPARLRRPARKKRTKPGPRRRRRGRPG